MKKICILGLASLFLLVGCGNPNSARKETYYDKDGKVYRVIDYTYSGDLVATMKITDALLAYETNYTYDGSLNLIRTYTRVISDNKYFDYSYSSCIYDNHNKLIGESDYSFDADFNGYILNSTTNSKIFGAAVAAITLKINF